MKTIVRAAQSVEILRRERDRALRAWAELPSEDGAETQAWEQYEEAKRGYAIALEVYYEISKPIDCVVAS